MRKATVIDTVPKNNGTFVRVALEERDTVKGEEMRHVVDIREFVGVGPGKIPMQKREGCSLPVARLPALIAALIMAQSKARELGLIGGGA